MLLANQAFRKAFSLVGDEVSQLFSGSSTRFAHLQAVILPFPKRALLHYLE